ncbi:FUSC family protein [Homoserinibacter sp. YIM 151385]|uniref:FUSC family protein n=1 Tax=Homoserinibacter sp. YIM 151385 TaxID=2985506 RepID=UPI0022F055E0|nr:FUSC family protein [Homoserinibacter sp. YIM 151385]WBU39308.1 FUSC family protein [Homoserinibacter sp. YIM 151385]
MSTDPAARLRRLERGVRRRLDARAALRRVWTSGPAIVQIVAAVAAAYSVAHWGLGHAAPIMAVTVSITSLGLSRDARPRRVAMTVLGIVLGIALADGLTLLIGKGLWQLVVVLLVVFVVGRAVFPNPAFAVAAAVPSALVVLVPDPEGGPFTRSLDGLVGGVMALLITAAIPRDPRRAARRDGRALFSVLHESAATVADALGTADAAAAELALARLRRTQPLVDAWTVSLDSAVQVSRIAPLLRRHLPELLAQERVLGSADLTARHLRLLARRVEFLVRDGRPRPELGRLAGEIATAVRLLGDEVDDRELAGAARSLLEDVARRLDPVRLVPGAPVVDSAIVLLLRPLVIDLLVGTGARADDARALLPDS